MNKKSIVELSKEMSLSRQAIHQKIKQEPLQSAIKDNIFYVGKKMFVDDKGEKLIRQAFLKSSTSIDEIVDIVDEPIDELDKEIDGVYKNVDESVDNIDVETTLSSISSSENISIDNEIIKLLQQNISVLQQQLETKDKQMEIKDKQIEELTSTVKIQAQSINHANQNELAETLIDGNQKLIEGSKPKKQGLFSKIFSRGNK